MEPDLTTARQARARERQRTERRRGRLLLSLLILAAGVMVYAFVQQLRAPGSAAETLVIADYEASVTRDRRPAPYFVAPALGGGTIHSSTYGGRVAVVNFWASWCGPCRQEAPALEGLWREYRDRGVRFIGVNFKDDAAAAQAYEDEFDITFRSAFDPSGKLAHEFGVLALPTTFVLGRDGTIEYQFTGIVSEQLLRDALEDLLRG
jgi:thiol-disulfide isomerase/thioredoxin